MEKTEKQKEVEALERNAENNIYCQNDRIVRQYYQVRILPNVFFYRYKYYNSKLKF